MGTIPLVIIGKQTGADPGYTSGPGEDPQGCATARCHTGTGNPTRGSGVEIDFGGGTTYTPGVKQRWTIRVTGASTAAYGFEVSARLANNQQAGSFASVNAETQVICADGREKPCRPDANVEYPTHTNPKRGDNSFEIEWTPPATASGDIKVFAAGNAANGNRSENGDRIFLNNFTLTPAAPAQKPEIRSEQPILQSFSDKAALSSGTWLQIFGTNLSPTTRSWAGGDFTENGTLGPTSLDGISVKINGKNGFINYISPTQINVNSPDDDSVGPVDVEVINPAGSSKTTITKTKVSPAMLTTPAFNVGGKQYVAALHLDQTTFVGRANLIAGAPFKPAAAGEKIIIYAVGCGPTNPASPAGRVVSEIRNLASPVQVRFGQTVATSVQAFLTPPFVGLCRIDVTVPNVASGDIAIETTIDGVATGQNLFTTIQ
ncbi:MAG: choice-of-anchor V domain-containing protein [Bryobacteraceae bacterium]